MVLFLDLHVLRHSLQLCCLIQVAGCHLIELCIRAWLLLCCLVQALLRELVLLVGAADQLQVPAEGLQAHRCLHGRRSHSK